MPGEVWILVESLRGQVLPTTAELLTAGRRLADAAGARLVAVHLGPGADALAPGLGGADALLAVDHPALAILNPDLWVRALAALLAERRPRFLLMGNLGYELTADLAARLDVPCLSSCQGLVLEQDTLVGTCRLYGGKLLAETACAAPMVLAQLLPGAFAPLTTGPAPAVEKIACPVSLEDPSTTFLGLDMPPAAEVDITAAPVLISVGRGIGAAENVVLAEELAAALGGTLAASRPVAELGWLPKARQVGKTGQTVRPRLYLAAGISGAPEHLEGMQGSQLIIAINTDPQAPIFQVAHYGVVGDCLEILPALTAALRAAGDA